MEIISKVVTYGGFTLPIVFFVLCIICYTIAVLGAGNDWDKDLLDIFVWLGSILFLVSLLCLAITPTKHERYKLRVNDSVTVKELSETYEIIEYDKDTDLWLVEKKEETDGH